MDCKGQEVGWEGRVGPEIWEVVWGEKEGEELDGNALPMSKRGICGLMRSVASGI